MIDFFKIIIFDLNGGLGLELLRKYFVLGEHLSYSSKYVFKKFLIFSNSVRNSGRFSISLSASSKALGAVIQGASSQLFNLFEIALPNFVRSSASRI